MAASIVWIWAARWNDWNDLWSCLRDTFAATWWREWWTAWWDWINWERCQWNTAAWFGNSRMEITFAATRWICNAYNWRWTAGRYNFFRETFWIARRSRWIRNCMLNNWLWLTRNTFMVAAVRFGTAAPNWNHNWSLNTSRLLAWRRTEFRWWAWWSSTTHNNWNRSTSDWLKLKAANKELLTFFFQVNSAIL